MSKTLLLAITTMIVIMAICLLIGVLILLIKAIIEQHV